MFEFKVGDKIRCIREYEDKYGLIYKNDEFIVNASFLNSLKTLKESTKYFEIISDNKIGIHPKISHKQAPVEFSKEVIRIDRLGWYKCYSGNRFRVLNILNSSDPYPVIAVDENNKIIVVFTLLGEYDAGKLGELDLIEYIGFELPEIIRQRENMKALDEKKENIIPKPKRKYVRKNK